MLSHLSEVVGGDGVPLLGGLPVPRDGFCVILLYTLASYSTCARFQTAAPCVAQVRRLAIPHSSDPDIFGYAEAIFEAATESSFEPLRGSWTGPGRHVAI